MASDEPEKIGRGDLASAVLFLGLRGLVVESLGSESSDLLFGLAVVGLRDDVEAVFEDGSLETVEEGEETRVLANFLVELEVQSGKEMRNMSYLYTLT